jgi:hypothetical protein
MNQLDPLGKDAHEPGAKLDAGKLRAGLVLGDFSYALQEVARVGTYGANKYTARGWMQVPNATNRYSDALWRHLLEDARGLVLDEESGLQHLAHAAWNILAVLELRRKEQCRISLAQPVGDQTAGAVVIPENAQVIECIPGEIPATYVVTYRYN